MSIIQPFFAIGPTELIPIAVILMLLFGAKKLPGLARNLGQSFVEFKRGIKDDPPKGDDQLPAGDAPKQIPADDEEKTP